MSNELDIKDANTLFSASYRNVNLNINVREHLKWKFNDKYDGFRNLNFPYHSENIPSYLTSALYILSYFATVDLVFLHTHKKRILSNKFLNQGMFNLCLYYS